MGTTTTQPYFLDAPPLRYKQLLFASKHNYPQPMNPDQPPSCDIAENPQSGRDGPRSVPPTFPGTLDFMLIAQLPPAVKKSSKCIGFNLSATSFNAKVPSRIRKLLNDGHQLDHWIFTTRSSCGAKPFEKFIRRWSRSSRWR